MIRVFGAREHNLRDLHIDLPRDRLTVITGLSGSGKSSLAFDTLYQEGQRRFLESLSAYARQFLGSMEKPRVDRIEGLSPTLCIDQKTVNRNPRSTVGTITEVLDHLRLFMARLGTPRCPTCRRALSRSSPGELVDALLRDHPDAALTVLAPIVVERKGEYRKELAEALAQGWLRARVDGVILRLDEPIELARYEKHTIELVVDRLRLRPEARARLVEAVERAAATTGAGLSLLLRPDGAAEDEHRLVSLDRSCPDHGASAPELEPRLFSFNAPQGMCPACQGLGHLEDFDMVLLLDGDAPFDRSFGPLRDEERLPFSGLSRDAVRQVGAQLGLAAGAPFSALPAAAAHALLHGAEGLSYRFVAERDGRRVEGERPWEGLVPTLRTIWKYTSHKGLQPFRRAVPCAACGGARLNPMALAVDFEGQNIVQLAALTVDEARAWAAAARLPPALEPIGGPLLSELRVRLGFLAQVGLGYLGLDRPASTLSGGEAQRIRLAGQVGAGLQGVTYVLDEPSIGLHPRDQGRLLDALTALRDKGNTVIVVEHDPLTMLRADHLVEIGPGAGVEGGRLIAEGPPSTFFQSPGLTARSLFGDLQLRPPAARRGGSGLALVMSGASGNNLRDVTLRLPLGTLTVVTGVSGSGKSTLISRTLARALAARLHGATDPPDPFRTLEGVEHIDKLVQIDQAPIGRTPRSNPATYTGAFDPIRDLFAAVPEARARGYAKGRFSFNVAGGRCEECSGAGVVTVEMQFLADVEIPCEACGGRRFNAETLDVRYRGRTITDVLEMSIAQAADFFVHHKKLRRVLSTLADVGLGYVSLGQPSTTLSGGEAQRIKLAAELARPATGRTLYVLDEPTTGLHAVDVGRLLAALHRLVDAGNTVLVIEHDTDVIRAADHVIDLGPEGGGAGGQITGEGPPEHIAGLPTPTGRALAEIDARDAAGGWSVVAEAARPYGVVPSGQRQISLRGVHTHNLRHIDVDLPEGKMTVITGPSGSGKTSLAFDTLFAEGQRRYVESLSTYARRFLGRMDRPPLDRAEGLAPAIAIDQRNGVGSPRSTVGTTTEIYDQLRLLYARVGQPHCPRCAHPLRAAPPGRAARELQQRAPGPGWLVCTLPDGARLADLRQQGFARLWSSGEIDAALAAEGPDAVAGGRGLVVDRLDPARAAVERVAESIATAYGWGGDACAFHARGGEVVPLLRTPTCPTHGRVLPDEITPRHFSFNSHWGACPTCTGLGRATVLDEALVLCAPEAAWPDCLDPQIAGLLRRGARHEQHGAALLRHHGVPDGAPAGAWPPEARRALLDGDPTPVELRLSRRVGARSTTVVEQAAWPGLRALIEGWGAIAERLRREVVCPTCGGGRLQPWVLAITLGGPPGRGGLSIAEACAMTVQAARRWWAGLQLGPADAAVAEQPLAELAGRLRFLDDVGLGYLQLDRTSASLSGGEAQRIRLATQLGARLTGTIYVLDEPTIGLHPRDTQRLLGTLLGLRDLGNTLVVVEHDPEVMRAADHLLEIGPGAGEHGGRVVAAGSPAQVEKGDSLTGLFLSGRRQISRPAARRAPGGWLRPPPAEVHNLRGLRAELPLGVLTVLTGVSGSGKSSLLLDHVAPWIQATGELRLVVVGQEPIGRSPRSTPATWTGAWDDIRRLFADTRVSRERGWTAGRFSYNAEGGRCEACEGRGATLIEMHFLSDVWLTCERCGGRRFNRETLDVRWRDHTIADVLDLPIEEAAELFAHQRGIRRKLQALVDVGLGYVRMGQAATTLSGGEAQRMKLAGELVSRTGPTVYLLDEPTTGLHLADVEKLLGVVHALVDQGHTVIVIEHHADVILNADHVLDLGPEGGAGGGQLLYAGPPEGLLEHPTSHTAAALRGLSAPAATA
jgi:excinuclease ABC subunit A